MPACRVCNQMYPQQFMVRGNGPRHEVCSRCAIETGMVSEDEAPWAMTPELAAARRGVLARRWRSWGIASGLFLMWFAVVGPSGLFDGIPLVSGLFAWLLWIGVFAAIFVRSILTKPAFEAEWSRLVPGHDEA